MKLKEIADIRTGLVLSRKRASLSANIQIRYRQITLKSFSASTSLVLDDTDEFVSAQEIADTYLSRVGDVLVRLREPITAVYIDKYTEDMIVPSLMCIIRVKNSDIYAEYLANYINSITVKKMLGREIKGTTIAAIKTRDLEDLEVILPPLSEQKSVVEFLKLSRIETELLERLKKQKEQFSQRVLNKIITRYKDK